MTEFSLSKKYANLPKIVIAGRPNVGKSTLFNRFLHKRKAITEPTPGVTRDAIFSQCFLCEKPVLLVDTGGFKLEREKGSKDAVLDEIVVEKTLETLKTADKILLLFEAGKITPEDEELIEKLRQYWSKLVIAVNKCEGGRLEAESSEFYKYGFEKLIFISAEHGDNLTELAEELVANLDFSNVTESEETEKIRVAIVGKPNVGKSTLLNRLTHSNLSIVSDVAGTTRDVVEGEFSYREKIFHILDTAGIRKKSKVHESVEYYSVNRAIKTLDEADIVFHLIDVNEGLSEQDKKIIDHAAKRGLGTIFVLNKWDSFDFEKENVQRRDEKKAFKEIVQKIHFRFGQMDFAPILPLSALNGIGVKTLLDNAVEIFDELSRKIDTSALNLALNDWVFNHPPPAVTGNRIKIRYAIQKSTRPVKFLIFATRPEKIPENYVGFLTNRIRKDLGFEKIPVLIEFKSSRQKWEDYRSGEK